MEARPLALRGLQGIALGGLALYALHAGAGVGEPALDGFAQDWLYNSLIAISAGLCIWRALAVAEERVAWLLMGFGLCSWFAGELYYTLVLSQLAAPPYPSPSDALYLAFYPSSYLALTLLARRRVREFPLSHWVDGVMVALAVAALGCAVLLGPVIEQTGGDWASLATDLAYPLADVILLALVAGTLAVSGWRPGRSWSLIGAALVGVAVADGLFLYKVTTGSYVEGTLLDALWPASTLLLGFAAWVRSERVAPVLLEGWRTLVIPSAFALVALGLLLASEFRPIEPAAVGLAAATLVAAIVRMGLTFGENMRVVARSRHDALTDALTGLWNRRKLMEDLQDGLEVATAAEPLILIVLDLDGFKRYNDTFGHPAGDALLARLGQSLGVAVEPFGGAYRIGGDEFCALVRDPGRGVEEITAAATAGLSEHGEGFSITASHGTVLMPNEATIPDRALQIADQRLYGRKSGRQRSAAAQEASNALMQALHERAPGLRDHLDGVASLARAVGRAMELSADDLDVLVRAAELHDVGKVAVPDSILDKPGPLDEVEWGFVRQHTVVGERILSAAPALVPVAKLVRASHERYDGVGYPDRVSGEEIPLGARIVTVCDAYGAMTSERPYGQCLSHQAALEELRRCAGRQFDPQVVETFCRVVHTVGDDSEEAVIDQAARSEVKAG